MDLTLALAGKQVERCLKDGELLVICCKGGYELHVGWKNPDTGAPIRGVPVIVRAGKVIHVEGPRNLSELEVVR